MLRIYESSPENFEWLIPAEGGALPLLLRDIQGTPVGNEWSTPTVELLDTMPNGKPRQQSDFPILTSSVLALSARAVDKLGEAVFSGGELLPVSSARGTYWLYNSLTELAALDIDESVLSYAEGRRVREIVDYVFDPGVIGDSLLFHMPYRWPSKIYFSSAFVGLVDEAGLTGLGEVELWRDA